MRSFVTHGPVPPESPAFVGRVAELKRMETWLHHVTCVGVVMGARQTGKTSLLLKLRHALRDKYAFVFVDFQVIEGAPTEDCFSYIAEQMVERLRESMQDQLHLPKDDKTFLTFLREVSAECEAQGELAFATRGAGQGEIGDVGACRQQQHADRSEENHERPACLTVAAFMQRDDHRLRFDRLRFVAAVLLEPAHDGRQFRPHRFDRCIVAQPRHHGIAGPFSVRVPRRLRHV